jgi:phosphatidylinositol kinase/protein kinase (PI-3  family)
MQVVLIFLKDIRTYGVVTLNEECGFIQWVPNTIPVRPVLLKAYDARNIRAWVCAIPVVPSPTLTIV